LQAKRPINQEKGPELQAFAVRLQGRTSAIGLKQVDIAQQLGMRPTRVSNWFQGLCAPSGINKKRLAELLEVPQDWLYKGKVGDPDLDLNPKNAHEDQKLTSKVTRLLMRPTDKRGVVALSPEFRNPSDSPKGPTREEIEYYLVSYLNAAEEWPYGDGLSAAYMQIMAHLRPSDFAKAKAD